MWQSLLAWMRWPPRALVRFCNSKPRPVSEVVAFFRVWLPFDLPIGLITRSISLAYAAAVACAHKSTLILFHAILGEVTETEEERLAYLEHATADITEKLYKMMAKDLPISCEVLIRHGAPTEITQAEMIIQTAIERSTGLIVMGIGREIRAIEAIPRSTVHTVLCNAPCPVMTVSDLCA